MTDRLDALETIHIAQVQATSVSQLAAIIGDLFADNGSSPITLATAHRSKGLENERIFLLEPEKMPLTWKGQRDWQFQQEQNLLYVALTRSKSELFLVGEPSWFAESEDLASEVEDSPVAELCKGLGVQLLCNRF